MIDLAKEIWQTMCTNKLRTALTGFSVAWGIFMLILLLAISNGIIGSFDENSMKADPFRIQIWPGLTSKPYAGLKEGRRVELHESHFDAVRDADPSMITGIEGEYTFRAEISTQKDYMPGNYCIGAFPSALSGYMKMLHGRFINEADLRETRKVIVITKTAAETLFPSVDSAVGKTVKAAGIVFTVVGVYDTDWGGVTSAYIPYSTAVALNGYDDRVDQMVVHHKPVTAVEDVQRLEQDVREALSAAEKFAPDDNSAIWVNNRYENYVQNQKGLSILNYAMWTIGVLTLITGIVGVSNIMFVSVRERTHEIGIRRALGARPASILRQVVLESIALTTVFGYIGIVMGTVACEVVKYVFRDSDFMLSPEVDLGIAVQVTVALIIAGALAGLFPALRALKVKPVEALRDE
ncbi:MAG: ABC transporter permease [Bacteroides sp.]|nr:ABC transporter permease [Bacteroides sp.]MCM1457643.1 ABC transporter permease [Lachnoclostridium sp.]